MNNSSFPCLFFFLDFSLVHMLLIILILPGFLWPVVLSSPRTSPDGDPLPFLVPLVGKSMIESRISYVTDHAVLTQISLRNNLVLYLGNRRRNRSDQLVDLLLNRDQWDLCDTFFARYDRSIVLASNTVSADLGIGPKSPLVASAESVAITDTQLVLGESYEFFANTCVPESVAQISFMATNGTRSFIQGSIDDGRPVALEIGSYGSPMVLTVSEGTIADQMEDAFERSGAIPLGLNQFRMCDRTQLFDLLPTITLSLYADDGLTVSARIAIRPEDYVDFSPSNECSLKVLVAEPPWFDPLQLPNVNVRVNGTHLWLCDSLVD